MTYVHSIPGAEENAIERIRYPGRRGRQRRVHGLVLSLGILLVAGCDRPVPATGESQLVAAAKAAVTGRLAAPDSAEFRHVIEYSDGVVCGEVNARKAYSGTDIGFRKFIYNAPEPEQLVLQNAELTRQEMSYWCSEEPDKKARMLAASIAELKQACDAKGTGSDMSCRLAATQKQALDELQAATPRTAAQPSAPAGAQAGASSTTAAAPAAPAPVAAAPATATTVVAAAPVAAAPIAAAPEAAPPAASPPQAAPSASANEEAAIVADVGAALQTWRERWQDGDVDGYLRMYAPSFTGGAGSRADWEQQRRQKMKDARPSIRVEKLEAVRITPQEVELRFVQVYAARRHRDRGNKTMVFQRTPQGWLIADERWAAAS